MGKKCCVPTCSSGYAGKKKNVQENLQKISIFSFTQDAEIRRKWIQAIPRDKWEPVENSGGCELHFKLDDFQQQRVDSNERRKRKKGALNLSRLKDDA